MRMGIDFGTTRTVVAAVEDGNYPVCTFNVQGELREYVPSLVAVKDHNLHFGWDAAALLADPAAVIVRSMKRLTGHCAPEELVHLAPGYDVALIDLVTLFLSHLHNLILRHSNLEVNRRTPLEVMVANPANSNSNQRYLTLEAFRRAGFVVSGVISEPSAAAIEYAQRNLKNLGPRSPKRYIVVYDLGGGTFDTAVVGLAGNHYDVIATDGVERLGGDDFDEAILELTLARLDPDRQAELAPHRGRLLEECRERKEGLRPTTRKLVVDLGAPGAGTDGTGEASVVLTTEALYEHCAPLVEQTVRAVQRVVEASGTAEDEADQTRGLAAVYLVGGSVAFPPVGRALRELYPRKVKISPFPHAATAIGLAIAADPTASLIVHETVSRHFGVWRENDLGRDKVFDPIFEKNLQVQGQALQVVRRYSPIHNIGHLRFFECSDLNVNGDPAGDITPWQEVYFPYDPRLQGLESLEGVPIDEPTDLGEQLICETYRYESSGIIHAEFENRSAGYRRSYVLGRTIGRASFAPAGGRPEARKRGLD